MLQLGNLERHTEPFLNPLDVSHGSVGPEPIEGVWEREAKL